MAPRRGVSISCFLLLPCLAASLAASRAGAPAVQRVAAAPPRAASAIAAAPAAAEREKSASNDLIPEEPTLSDWINNMPIAMSKSLARQILTSQEKDPEPLPGIWDWFWDSMPFLAAGKKGEPLTLGDVARTFKVNIEQIFGNIPAPDKAPLAAADVEGLDFKASRYGEMWEIWGGGPAQTGTTAAAAAVTTTAATSLAGPRPRHRHPRPHRGHGRRPSTSR
jgi:hypothetical protein